MGLLDGMFTGGGGNFSVGKAPQTAASFFLGGGSGRKRPTAPTLPTLEAPPTRDIRGEADTTGKTALASLLFNRLFGGSVQPAAALLGGMRKGYDSKFGNELADVQRTNQTAMQQFGANQAGFGNELRLDGMDRQDENDAFTRLRDSRNWERVLGRDAISDTRFNDNRDFQRDITDRQWKRLQEMDAENKTQRGLSNTMSIERMLMGLDPASQVSAAEFFRGRGVDLPSSKLTPAQKPIDPIRAQGVEARLKELELRDWWQKQQAKDKTLDRNQKGQQFNAKLGQSDSQFRANLNQKGQQFREMMDWKMMDGFLDSWSSGTKQPSALEIFKVRGSLDEAERQIRTDIALNTPQRAKERNEALRQIAVRRAELEQIGGQSLRLAPNPSAGAAPKPPTRTTAPSAGGVIRDPSKVSTGGLLKRLAEKYGGSK